MTSSYDVIVVGGGGSGLAAAVSAAQHGCSVLLLEKQPFLGGTTGIAVGSFTASRTAYQERAQIVDSPEAHAEDAAKFAPPDLEGRNHEKLRGFFLSESARTMHWLMEMGVRFHGPSPEPPNRVPRMHNVVPGAKAYVAALQTRLLRLGGRILCDAPVHTLLREGRRVIGVAATIRGEAVNFHAAAGVVLAAGDYANAPEMIARHKGKAFAAIEGINPFACGDGQRLAEQAGAQLLNMDVTYGPELRFVPARHRGFTQVLPVSGWGAKFLAWAADRLPRQLLDRHIKRLLVTWQHPENALFDDGAILINTRGERFCNEKAWPEREITVASQPGKIAFILLDARLAERYSAWPHFISTAPQIAYAYVQDYLQLRPDVAVLGRDLDELSRRRGLPVDPIKAAVASFNRYAHGAEADSLARTGDREPFRAGRWVLLGPLRACFTTTEGGAAINAQLQALDSSGEPIPGLYAVGQNGLGGQILWGHGLHIAWALTSGRLAGEALGKSRSAEGKGERERD